MFVASSRNTDLGIARKAISRADVLILNAVANALKDAERILETAHKQAGAITLKAQNDAVRIIADAKERADRIMCHDNDERLSVPELIGFVAVKHDVTYSAVVGSSRSTPIVAVRHEAIALVYERRPDLSLMQIAKFFGKDHTTIYHAVCKMGVHRSNGYHKRKADA